MGVCVSEGVCVFVFVCVSVCTSVLYDLPLLLQLDFFISRMKKNLILSDAKFRIPVFFQMLMFDL